jgi:hypothetical protein
LDVLITIRPPCWRAPVLGGRHPEKGEAMNLVTILVLLSIPFIIAPLVLFTDGGMVSKKRA